MKKLSIALAFCIATPAFASTDHHHHHRPTHHVQASALAQPQPSHSVWENIFGGTYASAYNGFDLMINGSWINADHDLLKIDQANPNKDSLFISGDIQALLTDNLRPSPQTSQIALQPIEVQSYTTLDHIFHAFTDSTLDPNTMNVYTPRAFVTLGDLNRSNFYATIGKNQVSFGQYSTSVINVLPEISNELGGITANSITMGMDNNPHHLIMRAFVYEPNVKTTDGRNADGGVDVVKALSYKTITATTGLSVISDLADSWAISSALGDEPLVHRIVGVNIRESLSLPANNALVAEYVTATSALSTHNLTTNDHAVQPAALHIEWNKGVTWLNKPVELALGYNQTYQAGAFNLPLSRFYGVATISPIRRSALSLEVNDDQNYHANDVSVIGGKSVAAEDGLAHLSVYLLAGMYF